MTSSLKMKKSTLFEVGRQAHVTGWWYDPELGAFLHPVRQLADLDFQRLGFGVTNAAKF